MTAPIFQLALLLLAPPPARVLGDATTAPSAEGQFSLRDASGAIWGIQLLPDARVQLVEPGARDLASAVDLPLASIQPGDRLLVRGTLDPSLRTALASSVIVMSKDALAAARAKEQALWRSQSLAGTVLAVQSSPPSLTLRVAQNNELFEWTIAVPPSASLLRYADDSIRFADARPASLADIHPGDQLRVLGPRDPDARSATAEKLLFGSFRTLGGEITQIDPEKQIITLRDVQTRKPVTLRINGNANLRRMPAGAGRPGMGPGMGMGAGMMRSGGSPDGPRRPDFQQMLDRLPAVPFSSLLPGDAVIVAAGRTAGPQPWSVVSLISGVDALLRAPAAQLNQTLGNWSMDLPMQ